MRKQRYRNVGAGKGVKARLDPDTLLALLQSGRSQAEIARLHDCTPQFVSLLVQEYGLADRSDRPRRRSTPARADAEPWR